MTSNGGFSHDCESAAGDELELGTPAENSRALCVLGTGDFGRAIAQRAVVSGYSVTIGTRSKEKQADMMRLIEATGATMRSQLDAIASAPLVVVAVNRDFYDTLPLQALRNKVLIDVSNASEKSQALSLRSNAEYLQELVPSATVVKALNVVSAYLLETGGIQGSKEIPLATDCDSAREQVVQLVRDFGFIPVDMGPLRLSREIEHMPLEFFRDWRGAFAVVASLFMVGYVINFIKFQLCKNLTVNATWDWSVFKEILMTNFNRNLGVIALITLGAVYLPGVISGYLQLYRGTKYTRFPRWLDRWLRMRKQLGLLMLAMAGTHGCISLGVYHPHHQYNWLFENPKTIRTEVKFNKTSYETGTVDIWFHHPNWRGELFLTLGAVSLCLLAILGIGSLPSVTARLSWREFAFIQSKLGWTALVAASLHDAVLGWDFMINSYKCFMPTGLQYALYLPIICVIGKLILLIPPINKRLMRIRDGWVNQKSQQV